MTVREKHAFDSSSLPDLCKLKILSSWESTLFLTRQRQAGGSNSWQQPLLQQKSSFFPRIYIVGTVLVQCICNCDKLSQCMRWPFGDSSETALQRTQGS